jgi:hypothetical protein
MVLDVFNLVVHNTLFELLSVLSSILAVFAITSDVINTLIVESITSSPPSWALQDFED